MGVSISAFLECLTPNQSGDATWASLADVHIDRDYTLFGLLAGVPDGGQMIPIVAPRGLPPQMSLATQEAWYRFGGSSASYLNNAELLQVQKVYSNIDTPWDEMRLVPRNEQLTDDWQIFEREQDIPQPILRRVYHAYVHPMPQGHDRGALVIALRHHSDNWGPNLDLAAVLAYLGVYEETGCSTRMVFWFN